MSTLVAQTISHGTVSTSSANVIQGSAKAWVSINASTQTIRSTYNVSSVTYIATGCFRITFTNAFSDANYAVVASGYGGVTGTGGVNLGVNGGNPTTTACYVYAGNPGNFYNSEHVNYAVFR